MPINRYFLSDFVSIQRQSFFQLLETGLIEEFSKRNPITNQKKDLSFFFYPEYYILTQPVFTPQEAILKKKSYISKLYVPAYFTDQKNQIISLNWIYIGNIPLMTKRGHFILNGAARVIVNQILRSPGVYYQQKIYENTNVFNQLSEGIGVGFEVGLGFGGLARDAQEPPLPLPYPKNENTATFPLYSNSLQCEDFSKETTEEDQYLKNPKAENSYKRYYADLICMRGTWLRIEMDKDKKIWAQMKKGPKIPIYWFLLAMGLSEKIIFKTIIDSEKLIGNLENSNNVKFDLCPKTPTPLRKRARGKKINKKQTSTKNQNKRKVENLTTWLGAPPPYQAKVSKKGEDLKKKKEMKKQKYPYLKTPPEAWQAIYSLISKSNTKEKTLLGPPPRLRRDVNGCIIAL